MRIWAVAFSVEPKNVFSTRPVEANSTGPEQYYVYTVGRNKKQIQEYIRNQLAEDQIADQIGMKEFVDPFTGSVNKKA